jgi:hypothetical protein
MWVAQSTSTQAVLSFWVIRAFAFTVEEAEFVGASSILYAELKTTNVSLFASLWRYYTNISLEPKYAPPPSPTAKFL